jgi:hypothetical protein
MRAERGPFLTVAAILFGILAISNLLKPLEIGSQTGFVFLGKRLTGTPNVIAGPIFGAILAAYAAGIWSMRKYALPIGGLYALYVILNLTLFPFRTPPPPGAGVGWQVFGLVYAAVAIGISAGAWWTLSRRRDELV